MTGTSDEEVRSISPWRFNDCDDDDDDDDDDDSDGNNEEEDEEDDDDDDESDNEEEEDEDDGDDDDEEEEDGDSPLLSNLSPCFFSRWDRSVELPVRGPYFLFGQ